MSLNVQHLNEDASFLLTFSPAFASANTSRKFPGSFTILIDPWLDGESTIYHPRFAKSRHVTPPAIKSLAQLKDEVDVIIISQEKADHLSKETLCTLPKNTKIKILATAPAAKKIRGWKYFEDPSIIEVMKPYQSDESSVIKIPIEPYSSASADGEITIANISEKRDITKLHNAIGITYRPPGTELLSWDGNIVKLDSLPVLSKSLPPSPTSPRFPKYRDVRGGPKERDFARTPLPPQPEEIPPHPAVNPLARVDTPQQRPSTAGSRITNKSTTLTTPPSNNESVISVIYTPHGLSPTSLQPYITHHLSPLPNALPVTALFHSFNTEANPWWLGGIVCKGAPAGVEIAHSLQVENWISAHDEIKEVNGWATKWTKSQRYGVQEVVKMLREKDGVGKGRARGTQVCVLGSGESRRFGVRDRERKVGRWRESRLLGQ